MFAAANHPDVLSPLELDAYLERGWFRMGQAIFTTNFLNFKDQVYSAIWLRINLAELGTESTHTKLSRLNAAFRVEIKKASITPEKEALFLNYKLSVAFEASASVHHLLYGKYDRTVFNTYEITIYDNDKLIACGLFDLGDTAGMGISSFYDPAYKKHSLGKYLIYLKMEYCKKIGLRYFYPGYFVPSYSFFDYKLTMGKKALYFLRYETGEWIPINTFLRSLSPLQVIKDKLAEAAACLQRNGFSSMLMKYEFFDANLIPDLAGADLFDIPFFLSLSGISDEQDLTIVVYDVVQNHFELARCKGVWKTNAVNAGDNVYSSYVLKKEQTLFTTHTPEKLAALLSMERKHRAGKAGIN